MNILFIVPSLYGGGAERVVSRLSSALCGEHQIYILSTWPEGNRYGTYELDPRITARDMILPEPEGMQRKLERRMPAFRAVRWWKEMKRLKRRWKIDVSISFLTSCNYDNLRSRTGEKTIISIRSILKDTIPEDPEKAKKEIARIRYAAKHASRIVAVSRNVGREQAERYGADPGRITTIYNPVDAAKLREKALVPVENEVFLQLRKTHRYLVITAGRLTAQKGQWHLVRAFREVRKQLPDAALVILGQGELQQDLQALTDEAGLHDHVLLAGFQSDPFAWFRQADLFVLPSLFEGFSNALLEAMALGLPLAACDCNSGPRELLAPETDPSVSAQETEYAEYGVLVPVCSGDLHLLTDPGKRSLPCEPQETALADAICRLLSDRVLREEYIRKASLRVQDFSTECILDAWRKLL